MGFVSKKRGNIVRNPFRHRNANMMHEIYFFVFQIFIVFVLVFLTLMQYVNNVATDLGFEKRFTSIDLGLLTTAVFYAPGVLTHTYVPLLFVVDNEIVQIDIIFRDDYLVNIKEPGKELDKLYWFLGDKNLDPMDDSKSLMPPVIEEEELESMISMPQRIIAAVLAQAPDYPFTYYKTGRKVSIDKSKVNPLQIVCPAINTTDPGWKSRKITVVNALPQQDYSKPELPSNRLAQTLLNRYSMSISRTAPADSEFMIAIGNSSQNREQRSLVAYVPVNDKLMQSRKLACFLINNLLTPETSVFYVQIMPIYPESIDEESTLGVLKKTGNQVAVFLDISTFSADQINIDKAADAIYLALQRYFGEQKLDFVSGRVLGPPQTIELPSPE